MEAPTHGCCSSSASPQWKEADKTHLVASGYSGVQEQLTTTQEYQQEVELLKLPSSQHLERAGKAKHEPQQQEPPQEHQLPVLHGQQVHDTGSDDGEASSAGPPGLTGQFSGDSASSVSTRHALAAPDANPRDQSAGLGKAAASPAGIAGQPQQQAQQCPAAGGHLPGSPVAAEGHRQQESLFQRASSQQVVLDVERDAAGAAGATSGLHSAASTSTVYSVLGDDDPMSLASTRTVLGCTCIACHASAEKRTWQQRMCPAKSLGHCFVQSSFSGAQASVSEIMLALRHGSAGPQWHAPAAAGDSSA